MRHFFYLIILLNFVCIVSSASREIKSGPYRSMLMKATTCKKFSYRLHKDPPIKIEVDVYNTSSKSYLTRGNLTVTRNVSHAKIRIKSFLWVNGKWKANYLVDSLGCNGMLISLLSSVLNVKYDKKHCMFLKGNYHYENIDGNELAHLITNTLEYGRTLWATEMYIPGKPFQTVFCLDYETWIVPI